MEKAEIIAKFAAHEGDTGSPEVQIALLTERIRPRSRSHSSPSASTTSTNTSKCTSTTTTPAAVF